MSQTENAIETAAKRQPVYWFTLLECAIEDGDFERAATAVRELRRMGIDVRYRRVRSIQFMEDEACPH